MSTRYYEKNEGTITLDNKRKPRFRNYHYLQSYSLFTLTAKRKASILQKSKLYNKKLSSRHQFFHASEIDSAYHMQYIFVAVLMAYVS